MALEALLEALQGAVLKGLRSAGGAARPHKGFKVPKSSFGGITKCTRWLQQGWAAGWPRCSKGRLVALGALRDLARV